MLPTAAALTTFDPGATRSGFTKWSTSVGPFELHGATSQSDGLADPCVRSAPTVMA